MMAIADVINYLSSNAMPFRVLTHPPVYSAADLARVHHVGERNVIKTELYKADHRLALAIVPADRKVDLAELLRHSSCQGDHQSGRVGTGTPVQRL